MAGLVPAIHVRVWQFFSWRCVDARDKPGHDAESGSRDPRCAL